MDLARRLLRWEKATAPAIAPMKGAVEKYAPVRAVPRRRRARTNKTRLVPYPRKPTTPAPRTAAGAGQGACWIEAEADARAEIEQAGEQPRIDRAGQQLGRRRTEPEQDGRRQRESGIVPTGVHDAILSAVRPLGMRVAERRKSGGHKNWPSQIFGVSGLVNSYPVF
jgi:hypothetical protein